jgi:hypothetical protein
MLARIMRCTKALTIRQIKGLHAFLHLSDGHCVHAMLWPPVGAAVGMVEGFTPTTGTGNNGAVPGQELGCVWLGGDGEGV